MGWADACTYIYNIMYGSQNVQTYAFLFLFSNSLHKKIYNIFVQICQSSTSTYSNMWKIGHAIAKLYIGTTKSLGNPRVCMDIGHSSN